MTRILYGPAPMCVRQTARRISGVAADCRTGKWQPANNSSRSVGLNRGSCSPACVVCVLACRGAAAIRTVERLLGARAKDTVWVLVQTARRVKQAMSSLLHRGLWHCLAFPPVKSMTNMSIMSMSLTCITRRPLLPQDELHVPKVRYLSTGHAQHPTTYLP